MKNSGCSSESGIMVLEQKRARKLRSTQRCHRTNPRIRIGDDHRLVANAGLLQGINDRIMHRSHWGQDAEHQRELPYWQKRRNELITPRRALVEKVFGTGPTPP